MLQKKKEGEGGDIEGERERLRCRLGVKGGWARSSSLHSGCCLVGEADEC